MNDYKELVNKAVEIVELTPPICMYEANNNGPVFCKPFEQFQSVLKDAADAIEQLVKERDAAAKCIEDIETYLQWGAPQYAYKVITEWRGVQE